MADGAADPTIPVGMGNINPVDPIQAQLQSNLQEWGLQGINPALFQAYLDQYMKDQQGQGDVPGSALQLLQQYMQAVQKGQAGQDQPSTTDEVFGRGVSGAQKVTQAADKLFGKKDTGDIADGPPAKSFQSGYNKPDQAKQQDQTQPAQGTAKTQSIDPGMLNMAAPAYSLGVNTDLGAPIPKGTVTVGPITMEDPRFQTSLGLNPMGSSVTYGDAPTAATAGLPGGELQLGPGGSALGGVPTSVAPEAYLGQGAGPSPLLDPTLDSSGIGGSGGVTGGPGVLGNIGAGLGVLGGGYGLYKALTGEGSLGSRIGGGLTSAASLYGGAAPLINQAMGSNVLPTLGDLAGKVLNMIPGYAAQAGAQAAAQAGATGVGEIAGPAISSGAEAGSAAAEGGAAAGAGAGAGAAGAGVAALPGLAITLAHMIAAMQDDQKAARDMKLRLKNISSQLPGELGVISRGGEEAAGLNIGSMDPSQITAELKHFNDIQNQFQQGGWEAYMKSGGTTVGGGTSGHDISVKLPEVQAALQAQAPDWLNMDVARLRLQDVLTGRGETQPQITQDTGRYLNPIDFLSFTNPQAIAALRPQFTAPEYSFGEGGPQLISPGNDPGAEQSIIGQGWAPVPAGRTPGMAPTGYIATDWGEMPRGLYESLYGDVTKAGGIEKGLSDWLAQNNLGSLSPNLTGSTTGSGGAGVFGSGLRSGGASDPEKGLTGIASATSQASLGTDPNPWAKKESSATLQPLQTLDELMAKAQAMGSGLS